MASTPINSLSTTLTSPYIDSYHSEEVWSRASQNNNVETAKNLVLGAGLLRFDETDRALLGHSISEVLLLDQGLESDAVSIPHHTWHLEEDTIRLLASVIEPYKEPQPTISDDSTWTSIKMDPAILDHDHELYMLSVWRRNTMRTTTPRELLLDTSLEYEWSIEELQSKTLLDRKLWIEKLDVDKTTRDHISALLFEDDTPALTHTLMRHSFDTLRMTSPVVPSIMEISPVADERDDLEIDGLLDDSTDTMNYLAITRDLEERINESLSSSARDIAREPVLTNVSRNISPHPERTTLAALKLTSPILPVSSSAQDTDYQRYPSDIARTKELLGNTQELISSSTSTYEANEIQLVDLLQPHQHKVIDVLQYEKLDELDTILRLPIPRMENSLLEEVQARYHSRDVDWMGSLSSLRWKGLSRLEQSLSWVPFKSSLARICLIEKLDEVEISIMTTQAAYTTSMLTKSHRPMVHIPIGTISSMLQDESSNVNTSTNAVSESQYLDQRVACNQQSSANTPSNPLSNKRFWKDDISSLVQRKRICTQSNQDTRLSNNFASILQSHGLGDFLHLKGISKAPREPVSTQTVTEMSLKRPAAAVEQVQPQIDFPMPLIESACSGYHIIVTPEVITQGQLVSRMEQCLPGLQIIERTSLTSTSPEHVFLEADITISPIHGLIITSLQKLKQRSLPGQATSPPLYNKVADIARQYSILTILVNESISSDCHILQDDDCKALAEFTAWTSLHNAMINVVLVAGDGQQLCTWICAYIAQQKAYALCAEESKHERILRNLGLNALAAQAILIDSAFLDTRRSSDKFNTALTNFICMASDDRNYRYSMLGDVMARRIQSTITSPWFSV